MNHVITLDLGPDILGYPTHVDGEMVCVLSPKVTAGDHAIQERARQFMKAQGRDCRTCRGCPVGTTE